MCGICGIINYRDHPKIVRMTNSLSHRGPDYQSTKILSNDRTALGHTRLSIIDLSSAGNQPMCDTTGQLWITYNGELYNYREIRNSLIGKGYVFKSNSDTEVILNAYHYWGKECVKQFNGMFAFAIWNRKDKTLFAARDHLGVKPFYYCFDGKTLVFASEIKAIIHSGHYDKKVDVDALRTPFMFQTFPSTGFKNIQKLQPGGYLLFRNNQLTTDAFWQLDASETITDDVEAEEQLDQLLIKSIERQMIADVPVGAFLSGGLDSSLIVAMMKMVTDKPIHTFTIKYNDADRRMEQISPDHIYAKKVADHFGCIHHELEVKPDIVQLLPKMMWHLDEPLADPASINTYLIAKLARENGIVVLLNGMGGDEVFGGYRTQLACLLADRYRKHVPNILRNALHKGIGFLPTAIGGRGLRNVRWAKRFLSSASLPSEERFYAAGWGFVPHTEFNSLFLPKNETEKLNFFKTNAVQEQRQSFHRGDLSYLTHMCLNFTHYFLPDHNLTYSDKATMAVGVESRPPFTDHTIVEYMFKTHPSLKIHGLTQKYLLKKVAEKYLPKEIVHRPKAAFGSPIRNWIKGPLSGLVAEQLSREKIRNRGLYCHKYVEEKIEKNSNGREDNAHLIWTLLCREIWLQEFGL